MLTENDIHHLVGLLASTVSKDAIEVELGTPVFHPDAEEERDVDVTITFADQGGNGKAYVGWEVKKHGRPLDITHVEQLTMKLQKMPELTHRTIVSASGFYEPARRFARKNGVQLLRLDKWQPGALPLLQGQAIVDPGIFEFTRFDISYVEPPRVDLRIDVTPPSVPFGPDAPVTRGDGQLFPAFRTHQELIQFCADQFLEAERAGTPWEMLEVLSVGPTPFVRHRLLDHDVHISQDGVVYIVKQVRISGLIEWQKHRQPLDWWLLVNDETDTPIVGCMQTEWTNGSLCAVSFPANDHVPHWINVSMETRLKKKIYRQKIQRS